MTGRGVAEQLTSAGMGVGRGSLVLLLGLLVVLVLGMVPVTGAAQATAAGRADGAETSVQPVVPMAERLAVPGAVQFQAQLQAQLQAQRQAHLQAQPGLKLAAEPAVQGAAQLQAQRPAHLQAQPGLKLAAEPAAQGAAHLQVQPGLKLAAEPAAQGAAQPNAPGATVEPTVQLMQPAGPGQSTAPVTVTLQDALERAKKNDATFLAAASDARSAHEDRVQAQAARLPGVSYRMDYLGTEGHGVLPTGRFVTNDGVHVYRAWGVIHEDVGVNTWLGTGYRRATAAEALAQAKAEIAQRGLTVTVTRNYYALVVAQRKYGTAQQSLQTAKNFFDVTADTERAGQAAHSDVIKAEIQYQQQQQTFEETRLAMENARLALAVLLFPTLNENFTAVDDLDAARVLPPFDEVQTLAGRENPDLRVALQTQRQAALDLTSARTAFFPSLIVEAIYGIEANALALRSRTAAAREAGDQNNLGYYITASLVLPVWDWGALRSKLHQAQLRQTQAQVELSQTQRLLISNLYNAYNEAAVARGAIERARHTADLAAESLRLVTLRYQSGAATILEIVDAQNTLTSARNGYDDAQVRYRVALAQLQSLTGTF